MAALFKPADGLTDSEVAKRILVLFMQDREEDIVAGSVELSFHAKDEEAWWSVMVGYKEKKKFNGWWDACVWADSPRSALEKTLEKLESDV